jgi:hypothetical protein
MIYIFKAPQKVCDLGCGAILGCCKGITGACQFVEKEFAQCLRGICGGCGAVFESCGKGVTGVCEGIGKGISCVVSLFFAIVCGVVSFIFSFIRCDQPLGPFVVMAAAVNAPAAWNALTASLSDEVKNCTKAPLLTCMRVDFGLALVNMIFASYFKHRVMYGDIFPVLLDAEQPDPYSATNEQLLPSQQIAASGPQKNPTLQEVGKRATTMCMEDVGFCCYCFIYVGSFVYQIHGFSYAHTCELQTSRPLMALGLLTTYPFLAGMYSCCFCCYTGAGAGLEALGGKKGKNQPKSQAAPGWVPQGNYVPPSNNTTQFNPQPAQALR